jgi:hypothetical protein
MEIVASASDWIFTDAERLRAFLETDTGKRFLAKLLERTPRLLPSGDTNSILIRSGEVRGIQIVAEEILALASPPPPEDKKVISETHPSLEDDAAWGDGESVSKPKDLFEVPKTDTPDTPKVT